MATLYYIDSNGVKHMVGVRGQETLAGVSSLNGKTGDLEIPEKINSEVELGELPSGIYCVEGEYQLSVNRDGEETTFYFSDGDTFIVSQIKEADAEDEDVFYEYAIITYYDGYLIYEDGDYSLIQYATYDSIPKNLSQLGSDSTHRVVTDVEKNTWNNKANVSDIPTSLNQLQEDSSHQTVSALEKIKWDTKISPLEEDLVGIIDTGIYYTVNEIAIGDTGISLNEGQIMHVVTPSPYNHTTIYTSGYTFWYDEDDGEWSYEEAERGVIHVTSDTAIDELPAGFYVADESIDFKYDDSVVYTINTGTCFYINEGDTLYIYVDKVYLDLTDNGWDVTNYIPAGLLDLYDDSTHRLVTDTEKATWNAKQSAISDLATIRSGAAAGATAVQSVNGKSGTSVTLTPADIGIGSVFTIKGSVATASLLPSSGNVIGDVYYVIDESVGYIWLNDGTTNRWEMLGKTIDLSSYQTKTITDAGSHFTTDTVEGALQEVGASKTVVSDTLPEGTKNAIWIDTSTDEGEDPAVRWDVTQNLSNVNKQTARANINAADAAVVAAQSTAISELNGAAVKGVKVDGTDLTKDSDGKVDIPMGSNGAIGLLKGLGPAYGVSVNSNGGIYTYSAIDSDCDNKVNNFRPIVPLHLDYAIRAGLLSNSKITDADKPTICQTIGAQMKYATQSITIAASAWSNNSVTVNATGVTATNLVQLSVPTKADMDKYGQAGVFCSAQGAGTLTFTCAHTPTDSITVNAVIWG